MSTEELKNWRINTGINSLFFDGASKINPGIAGAGGVILDHNGNKQTEFAQGLGRATNNGAEWYALIKGLELAREMGIEEMNVIGDSLIVIKEARYIYKNWKTPHSKMHRMLLCLVKEFKNITVLHVLRRENQQADCMANKGASLNCGVMEKDRVISADVWIP